MKLVIIPCGSKKAAAPCPAKSLYLGSYFNATLQTALVLTGGDESRIRILSGKHGLLALDQIVAPYEQRIDQPGAITPEAVACQAKKDGLLGAEVIILAGSAYTSVALRVWPEAGRPFLGTRGIGEQLALMKRIRADA